MPGRGTFTTVGAPTGSVTFTPVMGNTVATSITYTVQDEVGATSSPATITVSIAGPAFSCNSVFYRVSLYGGSSKLERLDRTGTTPDSLTYTSSLIYDTGDNLNALFLNFADGYLYAFRLSTNRLFRLSTTGVQDLGTVTGLPAGGFNSATADLTGNAYLANNTGVTTMYRLNVATRTVTALPLSQAVNFGDMGYNPADGYIYASRYYPGGIYRIDLVTAGATRPVTLLGTPANSGQDVGSIFFDASGLMYAATNQGTLAAYQTSTGLVASIGSASNASQSDGASCVFPIEEIDVVQVAATPVRVDSVTFDVTFTTRLKNTGAVTDPNIQATTILLGPNGTFPTADTAFIVGTPSLSGTGTAGQAYNTSFTGRGINTGLLTGTASMLTGRTLGIVYTVRVKYVTRAAVPSATQFNQVYASTASNGPNTGYVIIGGIPVPPATVLDGDVSTNTAALPAHAQRRYAQPDAHRLLAAAGQQRHLLDAEQHQPDAHADPDRQRPARHERLAHRGHHARPQPQRREPADNPHRDGRHVYAHHHRAAGRAGDVRADRRLHGHGHRAVRGAQRGERHLQHRHHHGPRRAAGRQRRRSDRLQPADHHQRDGQRR